VHIFSTYSRNTSAQVRNHFEAWKNLVKVRPDHERIPSVVLEDYVIENLATFQRSGSLRCMVGPEKISRRSISSTSPANSARRSFSPAGNDERKIIGRRPSLRSPPSASHDDPTMSTQNMPQNFLLAGQQRVESEAEHLNDSTSRQSNLRRLSFEDTTQQRRALESAEVREPATTDICTPASSEHSVG